MEAALIRLFILNFDQIEKRKQEQGLFFRKGFILKRILITGIDGFFGRHLQKELELRNPSYLGIVIKQSSEIAEEKQIEADITDYPSVLRIIKEYQPDVIIHLAAIASVTYNNTPELYRVNVCGAENILLAAKEAGKKGCRMIMISSAGVYGIQKEEYLSEELQFNPVNHYSYTKMVMEVICRQYRKDFDIKIVRPFTVVGRGQSSSFFVSKLVSSFSERKPVIELGNIESVRDYTDVELCANTLAELACREYVEEKVLNICTGVETTGNDVIEMLKQLTGFEPKITISSKYIRENEIWRLVGDNRGLKKFLGQKYKYKNIMEILKEMLEQDKEKERIKE